MRTLTTTAVLARPAAFLLLSVIALALYGGVAEARKVISVISYTARAGWMKMSQRGRSGLRCSRASTACMAFLETETPLS